MWKRHEYAWIFIERSSLTIGEPVNFFFFFDERKKKNKPRHLPVFFLSILLRKKLNYARE